MPLSATRAGRVNHMNTRIGMANRIADRSGWEIAQDLGAISPMTRWKKVTITKATTKETVEETASGSRPSNKGSMRWWTAGLVIAPNARVHRVIPNWDPASSRDRSRALRSAARADRLVSAASSSR